MRRRRHTRSRPRPSAIVNSWLAVAIVLTLYPPRTKRSYLPRITRPRAAVTVGRPGLLVVVADVSGIARRSRGPHNRISTWLTPVNGSRRRRDGRHPARGAGGSRRIAHRAPSPRPRVAAASPKTTPDGGWIGDAIRELPV